MPSSLIYIFCPLLVVAGLVGLFFLLRNRSQRTKWIVIAVITWVNVAQHLLKSVLYPHLWGTGFSFLNTANNVCAFLVLLMPFMGRWGSQAQKDFIYTTGFAAGLSAMLFPACFVNQTLPGWELFRFYFCHGLLLYSAALPLLLGIHRISWKSWYKFAPQFVLMLALVLLDNILCIYMGITPGATPENMNLVLWGQNPLWMMGPPEGFEWMAALLEPFTPDVFLRAGHYVPILWYAWPLFIPMSLAALGLFALVDRKRFREDVKRARN